MGAEESSVENELLTTVLRRTTDSRDDGDDTPAQEETSDGTSKTIIQIIFALLGIGILVPWNAFISAKGYFTSRLCADDSLQNMNIESTFAMVYNLAAVVCLASIIVVQGVWDQMIADRKERRGEVGIHTTTMTTETSGLDPQPRSQGVDASANSTSSESPHDHSFWLVMVPLSITLAVFVVECTLVLSVNTAPRSFLTLNLIGVALCGATTFLAQAGIVATAGLFDGDVAMAPFLAGQSAGGVFVSLANFAAAVSEDRTAYRDSYCSNNDNNPENEFVSDVIRFLEKDPCLPYDSVDWGMFFYFFLGSLVLLACLAGYSYVSHLHHGQHHEGYDTVHSTDSSRMGGLELHDRGLSEPYHHREESRHSTDGLILTQSTSPIDLDGIEPDGLIREEELANETAAVWKHVKGPASTIFIVFFVTLGLFPGYVSELRSAHQCRTHLRLTNDLYTPFSFVLFNCGDLVGRLLAARVPLKRMRNVSRKLVIGSLLRFLFFPLLFMCPGGSEKGPKIPSDLYSELVQFAFAVSNGLLLTIAFVHAPTLLPSATDDMEERMAELLTFAVAFGLLCGSLFSFPVTRFATG